MNQLDYSGFKLHDGVLITIQRWQQAVLQLESAKANELELRKGIVEWFFPTGMEEGKNRITGADFQIDVTQPMNVKIDPIAVRTVISEMPAAFQEIGVLIDWKPALVKSGYDALPEEHKKIFDQALTIEPGTPQLKVKLNEPSNVQMQGTITPDEMKRAAKQALSDELRRGGTVPEVKAKRGRKPKAK